jgi:purine-binding chemotaxis protein CheW
MAIATENEDTLQLSENNIENEKKERLANIDFKMIGFSLAGKDYAIDIMKVKEIATAGKFTFVPNTAPFVLGVYNLRGDIIPMIDLRIFFNIQVPERTTNDVDNMIIVSIEDRVFGVVVDEIDKVVGIQKKTIQPPHPLFGDINIKYIYGVVESNERLYILLDIDRVFGIKTDSDIEKKALSLVTDEPKNNVEEIELKNEPVENVRMTLNSESKPKKELKSEKTEINIKKETALEQDSPEEIGYSFIVESLRTLANFYVSDINEDWVKQRYSEWIEQKGSEKSQITSVGQANEFLNSFYSKNHDELWQDEYCNAILKLLPDNSAKQINVWNPGCGKGYETYSLCCVLHKRYPDAKIKIYAQDVDLLNISNASILTFTKDKVSPFFDSYMVKTVKNTYSFSQDIKDSIQFEYHDCTNSNTNPPVDIIFMRDILSFISSEDSESLYADMEDKLKGNGSIIIGDNEVLVDHSKWIERSTGLLTIYSKI